MYNALLFYFYSVSFTVGVNGTVCCMYVLYGQPYLFSPLLYVLNCFYVDGLRGLCVNKQVEKMRHSIPFERYSFYTRFSGIFLPVVNS